MALLLKPASPTPSNTGSLRAFHRDTEKGDDKILYINRRLKAISHNKGFNFLDVYWPFDGKPYLFKDGLHLNGEGAGILGTSVRIATQVHLWT